MGMWLAPRVVILLARLLVYEIGQRAIACR